MAKSLVVNTLGGKRKFIYLPCNDTVAADFATQMLDGEHEVYAKESAMGTDSGITAARSVTVSGKDTTTFKKATLSFTAKANKSTDDIELALKGKTYNGVKFDEVTVIKSVPLSFS